MRVTSEKFPLVTSLRLSEALDRRNMTQRQLCRGIGMYEQTLSNKIHGRRPFTVSDLSQIADYLGVSTDWLLGREPTETNK
ncbi:MAG: helix-turn-helix domain-containing protein [Bifidobacterium crudilactis]|uniref:helix-turn-helix domain-containing protein n=1 Tax=Bifidobacterium crudilactis TaxID=327277 RepID=UPI003F9C40FD